tara:strand:- start:342 stop:575 length:234 start_codon:yes stop_codon:yes gene_type:complete
MKSLFLIFSGLVLGLWAAWPGVIIPNNWKCFRDIIVKSSNEQISFKAALALSPNYLLKGKRKNNNSKIRVVFDACFR